MKLLSRSDLLDEFPNQFVRMIYDDTIDKYKKGETIDEDKLRRLLIHLDDLYSNGKLTPLLDFEYDTLHEIYAELSGEIIRGDTNKEKIKHDYPNLRGTLKKVHYIDDVAKNSDPNAIEAHKVLSTWYYNTYAMLDKSKKHKFGMWLKYNGISLVLSLDENRKITKAVTRGETDVSEFGIDKTNLFDNIVLKGIIPDKYDGMKVGLKTECIMKKELFSKYNKKYGNDKLIDERAAVTSLINSKNSTDLHIKYIDTVPLLMEIDDKFVSFNEYDEYGPVDYYIHQPNSMRLTVSYLEEMVNVGKRMIEICEYDCDGLVFRWYDEDAMETLGRDEENAVNRFEIAFKFPRDSKYTKLIDIKQDIGLLGKVSFTAEFEPVDFKKKVTHASLGSYDRVKELNLAKGDTVKITYEIIPYLLIDEYCKKHKSNNPPIEIISKCPYCGEDLDFTPEYSCINQDCPSRIQGKIYNFCIRMGIPNIGESTVEDLFHAGLVTCIEDLFDIPNMENEITSLDGFGKKTFKHLAKSFKELKATEAQLLASLSIPGIGNKKSSDIIKIYNINSILEISENNNTYKLTLIDGISTKTANKLIKGINDNKDLIEFLLDHITIKNFKAKETLVFTGFRNPSFEKYLNDKHVQVVDSLNDKVDYIIARDPDATSSKLEKGRKKGIPIISEIEAYEMYGYKGK